ncbi:hypothetical protein CORT_0A08460 [Candida orthopsilosis Co 90-125]|uniref:Gvp36 protein n=1 Tax=Candida orthopsilosis (strain 90-125) TaxID=1136231 RepID=H8WYB5_CANO9|nr:hypothetical protein CORT_0A08460 [Candida orthopsilosis Co 90-125]CCG21230.1 hypothetical protein CORT_0A08460 [Candida orthopsilosis Co 90-125]
MSFKFPSFDLKSIQESLPTVDQLRESFSKVNPSKTVEQFRESIQPFASKTQQLINEQLHQVQALASNTSNIEVSELPQDYLQLEIGCDLLLKLYSDLIQTTNETYGQVSYDYPPGNYTINKIRDAHVGNIIGNKFNQLKNVSSPQELEKILMGEADESNAEGQENKDVSIQPTSPDLPKTLYGHLSTLAAKHSEELQKNSNSSSLAFVLLKISSTYHEIGLARLDQDKTILKLNHELIEILNAQFIKVNELRKKVYFTRSQFDQLRNKFESSDPENEELISKEDELVSATELAVIEMKKLLKPSKNIDLLKIFVKAQKEYFELGAKKLENLLGSLDEVKPEGEDEEE